MGNGFNAASGCYVIAPDRGQVRLIIDGTKQPVYAPVFQIVQPENSAAWVYVDHLIFEKVARSPGGGVVFQLPPPGLPHPPGPVQPPLRLWRLDGQVELPKPGLGGSCRAVWCFYLLRNRFRTLLKRPSSQPMGLLVWSAGMRRCRPWRRMGWPVFIFGRPLLVALSIASPFGFV